MRISSKPTLKKNLAWEHPGEVFLTTQHGESAAMKKIYSCSRLILAPTEASFTSICS